MNIQSPLHLYQTHSMISIGLLGDSYIASVGSIPNKLFQITIENKERIKDNGLTNNVQTEHSLLIAMNHQCMPKCIEIFEDETNYYMVYEFFASTTLEKKLLELNRIAEEKIQFVFLQIIDFIQYLHSNGFAYGALRLENILINEKYEIMFNNFSCIQSLTLPIPKNHFIVPPPEVIEDEENCHNTALCEIFSLGVLLYMTFSRGLKPWDAHNETELKKLFTSNMLMQPPSMSHVCFGLVQGMLEMNFHKRFTLHQIQQHPWVQRLSLSPKPRVQVKTPVIKHIPIRRTSMKTFKLPDENKRNRGENNPALANSGVFNTCRSMKHRQSGFPRQSRLPQLDLFFD